jgi:monoamine oxidase
MSFTRRDFVTRLGQVGGYSAAFTAMQTLGLMPVAGAQWRPIEAAVGVGKGVRVVVLGGGMAGMVAGFELKRLGYTVTVLEANGRPGGRVWTGRRGDKVEFVDGTTQTIAWSAGNYQNMGAARIPSTHWTILKYCRELKVPLEIEVNTSRSTLLQNDAANDSKPVTQRRMDSDTRGHVSELLAKCVMQGALDADFSAEDKDRMLTMLRSYGDLDKTNKFVGGSAILGRAGFRIPPAAGTQVGVVESVLDMKTLLDENMWNGLLFTEEWHQQATMMQAVGGNDRIPYAFARELGSSVHFNSPVKSFKRVAKGVSVTYTQGGVDKNLEADYCVVAMPFEILKKLENDLSPAYKSVISGSTPAGSYKIAWESRRFWEQDYNIYGGLSWLAQGPSPVWYPSANLMAETGVVVSGYKEEQNTPFWALTMEEKFAASRASVEKLHPGHGKELTKPCYVGWRRMKWFEASWLGTWGGGRAGYNVLLEPDGPYFMAGDGISNVNAWMEGAALSAKRAVQLISDKVKAGA